MVAPASAHAQGADQEPTTRLGAFIGGELDNSEDWILLGAEGRIPLQSPPLEVNPRFTYHPFTGGSIIQLDVNFLHNYRLANPGRLRPYVGIGGAFHRLAFDGADSDSKVGLNLLSGARIALRPGSRLEPFFNAQYTIIQDELNSFTFVIGASYSLR
jgi:hypothetical protein